jgi:hypothetical protein
VRLIVDPDGEYSRHGLRCRTLEELCRRAQGSAALTFVPSADRPTGIRQFAFICSLAWSLAARRPPVLLVVDELSEFTTATEAPFEWRRVVKRGRKAGISVLAAAQRPAEIDKTIWSNASLVRAGRLNYPEDQRTIAAAIAAPLDQVVSLGNLDYLERDHNAAQLRRGRLTF